MTKKGLSLEEKRNRILEIFHDTDDVYQLKDIEKLAVKKGVTLQSVKEVVQSLVDDDLVHQDKIGISNFLWAFAAEASTKVKINTESVKQRIAKLTSDESNLDNLLTLEKAKHADIDERQALQRELAKRKEQLAALQQKSLKYASVDPARVDALKEAAVVARDAANRWLDNTHALLDWCKKNFTGREAEVEKFFEDCGLTDKVDYLT